MKIAVAGTGYVGLSISVLLSQKNEVTAVDIIKEKVDMINSGISPIVDKEIEEYLKNKDLNLTLPLLYEDFESVAMSRKHKEIGRAHV